MQIKHKFNEFAGRISRRRIGIFVQCRNQLLEPAQGRLLLSFLIAAHVSARWIPNMGECTVFKVLPPPRYMCTPQGRHGSKLLTARMMSMPLNLSGGFSSKIGVPLTESSYGPGVPYLSRGVPFQGVGG